ncbi:MAG: hypothetical protein IKT74_03575, partial [Bacteroidales bacterium]|nr:hypothetical protein [Bacteroidales bacterium]
GTPGKYIYPVQNGSVHRYEGSSFWAKNKNVYIMDRNLGSLNSDTYPSSKQGLVYYQFGRKDPFFHSTSVYKYKDLNARYTAINYDVANNSTNAIKGMAYTVINPLHFINGKQVNNSGFESWIHDDTYAPAAWHDPHAASLGRKSIFDPCPPGYKVPDNNNVWQDLTYQGKKNKNTGEITYKNNKEITTNIFEASDNVTIKDELKRGFKPFMTVKGMQYWPAGDGSNIPQQVIFYPSSGFLNQTSGNINYDGHSSSSEYWGYAWTTESNTKGYGASLVIQPDMISKAMSNRKSRGLPVRCITDRK